MPLTFLEALAFAEQRKVVLPDTYANLQGSAKNRAFSVAGVAARDQLQGVLDSLLAVQKEGLTFDQWKERVRSGEVGLGLPDHRLDTIFRNNMQTAYSGGHWTQQQKHKARRPYLMYDALNDSRTRPSHLELDNVIRPIDDPFWETHYTPNGHRCRCSTISMTEAQAQARGGVTPEPVNGWPKPDKGWDYNPGADPDRGITQSAAPKQGGSPALQSALEARPAPGPKAPVQSISSEALAKALGSVDDARLQPMLDLAQKALSARGEWDSRVFDQPLRRIRLESELGSKGTAEGVYYSAQRDIGLNRQNLAQPSRMAGTMVHELGHHIDFTTLKTMPRLRQELLEEFNDIHSQLKEAKIDASKLLSEGKDMALLKKMDKAGVRSVSTYALTNDLEWISECFHTYIYKPYLLEIVAPRTFAAFERFRLGEEF